MIMLYGQKGETMTTSPTTYGMSPECKSFVVKKVYDHYTMNIFWKEVCQKFSTMCVFIFPIMSLLSGDNYHLEYAIIILSGVISLLVSFFCDTKEYLTSFHIVREVYTTKSDDNNFETKFQALMPYIREIDFARGRSDYAAYCKELGITQNLCDMVTRHDIDEMNRQRYIIAVLCFMAALICSLVLFLLPDLDVVVKIILAFIILSTIIGFIFMLIDCKWISTKKK